MVREKTMRRRLTGAARPLRVLGFFLSRLNVLALHGLTSSRLDAASLFHLGKVRISRFVCS
jgi:hypothetical protein